MKLIRRVRDARLRRAALRLPRHRPDRRRGPLRRRASQRGHRDAQRRPAPPRRPGLRLAPEDRPGRPQAALSIFLRLPSRFLDAATARLLLLDPPALLERVFQREARALQLRPWRRWWRPGGTIAGSTMLSGKVPSRSTKVPATAIR